MNTKISEHQDQYNQSLQIIKGGTGSRNQIKENKYMYTNAKNCKSLKNNNQSG